MSIFFGLPFDQVGSFEHFVDGFKIRCFPHTDQFEKEMFSQKTKAMFVYPSRHDNLSADIEMEWCGLLSSVLTSAVYFSMPIIYQVRF